MTTNLLSKIKDQGEDIFSYLENEYYKNRLDKSYYAVLSYKLYELYSNKKYKRQINYKGWNDYSKTTDKGLKSHYRLFNREDGVILSGEVLSSSTGMLSDYKKDISGKEKISNIAKMYFNLVTTVGNIMPWPMGFNTNLGNSLDIFQEKFTRILGLYEWMRLVGKEPIEDGAEEDSKSINCEREEWIKNFLSNHYLQDFVWENKGRFEAFKFFDLDTLENLRKKLNDATKKEEKEEIKRQIEKEWNLFFYRSSKAIMKRSYRILKTEEIKEGKLSEEQREEFEGKFREFCNECGVKDDLKDLKDYLSDDKHKDRMIKDNELEELEKLIKELK